MLVGGLRVEDRLAGDGNWSPWKARIVLILEEGELWDIDEESCGSSLGRGTSRQEDYSRCSERPYNSSYV
jgi:hypothetical protein